MLGAIGLLVAGWVPASTDGNNVVRSQKPRSGRVNETNKRGATLWPNGWSVSPAGRSIHLPGDMPATILALPDGKRALVNTCGFHDHSLNLVDLTSGRVLSSVGLVRSWIGLSYDEKRNEVFLSGGSGKGTEGKKPVSARGKGEQIPFAILRFKIDGNQLVSQPGLDIPKQDLKTQFVSSILRVANGDIIAANIQSDTVFRLSGDGSTVKAERKVGYRPYGLALSPDSKTLAVTNWGDKSVSLLDAGSLAERSRIKVGAHPNALLYLPDGRLVVANAGSDSLSVILGGRAVETIPTTLALSDPLGAAPIALAYSPKRRLLFSANSDNNAVAVVDMRKPRHSQVIGFIPTGRYPSALALSRDESKLLVGTAKGMASSHNAGPKEASEKKATEGEFEVPYKYIGNILSGDLSIVRIPNGRQLQRMTASVKANRPDGKKRLASVVEPGMLKALHGIEHVVYVIKENRTYDQVLGDDPRGNGEKDLVMFGNDITPNEHKIVKDFVLFDNIFCDGEVSQVGHQWTDGAYAGDYTEKQWILGYGDHEEVESDTRLNSSPGGFLWQNAKRHGRSTRIYGEYLQWQEDHSSAHGDVKADPEKYGCSAAFEKVFGRGGRDTEKVDVFLNEMHAAEKKGKWPNFMVMALPEDHTHGFSAGSYSPQAMVGSNDLAVGRLIEGISHSKFWSKTAVFIIQDDAQDGPDHVDCHRTVGMLVCPLVKRGLVDHTMYSTSSMIRTIELMLGLPPMSQYDANAMPMIPALSRRLDLTPYVAVAPGIDINKKNPAKGELARRSAKLDFSDVDRCDPQELNAILWKGIRPGQPEPAPVHGRL